MTHRALIVAAVSTPGQAATDKASIPEQLSACHAACDAHGWPVVAEITIPGHSRNYNWLDELVADCPEYGAITRSIRSGNISLILVRDYDRLWRTDALRAQVMALCREHQVQVYALNQPVEPIEPDKLKHATSDSAMILEAIGGVIAESENKARIRRSRSGKEARIRQGYTIYAQYAPYGYIKDLLDRIIKIDPVTAPWVLWIFERHAHDRWGYKRIADELERRGIPSPRGRTLGWSNKTISRIIRCPVYYGATYWGSARCEEGKHAPIVTHDLWQLAQQATTIANNSPITRALTGLCVCGYCGHHMVYSVSRNRAPRLRCDWYLNSRGQMCQSHYIIATPIESYVYQAVLRILSDPNYYIQLRAEQFATSSNATELDTVDRQLADLTARLGRWSQAYEIGSIGLEELLGHRQRIGASIGDLKRRRVSMQAGALALTSAVSTINELAVTVQDMPNYSPSDLRAVYARLIHHIIVRRSDEPQIALL